jgi:hypothetical protein
MQRLQMTETLTQEDVEIHTSYDPEKHAHYVKKKRIVDASVGGYEIEALCGYRFIPTKNPDKLPICPPCKEIFENGSEDERDRIGKYI